LNFEFDCAPETARNFFCCRTVTAASKNSNLPDFAGQDSRYDDPAATLHDRVTRDSAQENERLLNDLTDMHAKDPKKHTLRPSRT
jgi:hypothetical protein